MQDPKAIGIRLVTILRPLVHNENELETLFYCSRLLFESFHNLQVRFL